MAISAASKADISPAEKEFRNLINKNKNVSLAGRKDPFVKEYRSIRDGLINFGRDLTDQDLNKLLEAADGIKDKARREQYLDIVHKFREKHQI